MFQIFATQNLITTAYTIDEVMQILGTHLVDLAPDQLVEWTVTAPTGEPLWAMVDITDSPRGLLGLAEQLDLTRQTLSEQISQPPSGAS